jgi:predicted RNase H-like HicB family nuclease
MVLLIQVKSLDDYFGVVAVVHGREPFYKYHVTRQPMLRIESEKEEDGRWIAEVPALPGVLAYGTTKAEVDAKVKALALRVIADRLENGEQLPSELASVFEAA